MCPPARTEHEASRGPAPEAVRVWLLGGYKVSIGSRTVGGDAWRLRKAAAHIKLLALAPGHRFHREQIMDLCWSDSLAESFVATLKTELHYRKSWPTRQVMRTAMIEYIEDFYTTRRRHSALGHLSSAEFEKVRLEEEDAALQKRIYRTGVSPRCDTNHP